MFDWESGSVRGRTQHALIHAWLDYIDCMSKYIWSADEGLRLAQGQEQGLAVTSDGHLAPLEPSPLPMLMPPVHPYFQALLDSPQLFSSWPMAVAAPLPLPSPAPAVHTAEALPSLRGR